MSYNITFSKYHEELRKEAEERLAKQEKFNGGEGYSYEIVLVPTGVVFDKEANELAFGVYGEISKPESKIKVLVVPTNEELMIARDTVRLGNIK